MANIQVMRVSEHLSSNLVQFVSVDVSYGIRTGRKTAREYARSVALNTWKERYGDVLESTLREAVTNRPGELTYELIADK